MTKGERSISLESSAGLATSSRICEFPSMTPVLTGIIPTIQLAARMVDAVICVGSRKSIGIGSARQFGFFFPGDGLCQNFLKWKRWFVVFDRMLRDERSVGLPSARIPVNRFRSFHRYDVCKNVLSTKVSSPFADLESGSFLISQTVRAWSLNLE